MEQFVGLFDLIRTFSIFWKFKCNFIICMHRIDGIFSLFHVPIWYYMVDQEYSGFETSLICVCWK